MLAILKRWKARRILGAGELELIVVYEIYVQEK